MSSKGRKSLSNCWYTCEKCGIFLTHKDKEQHNDRSCPPDGTDWEHPFIKDRILFSFAENSNINDSAKVQDLEKHFFVYLSQSAMQLCHFEIGEQVLIFINKDDSVIQTVWPTAEKTLTSVVLHTLDPAIRKSLDEGGRVKVQKLINLPTPASLIHLAACDEIAPNSVDQLLMVCKQLYTGKLLKLGSKIIVPFYGINTILTVKNVMSAKGDPEETLAHQIEDLNINQCEGKTQETYFLAVESSKWEISQNIKYTQHKHENSKIVLKNVGGYIKIIQELLRSINNVLKRNNSPSYMTNSLGVLMYGPNGVGKTYITQAVANEVNVHIVKINSGELFSKFYGETELRLRNLFTEAKNKSPTIIILDNVETLCPKRGGTEQERRTIAYLLTLLDSLKDYRTVVLATTSQLQLVDTSLRRPGRLDCEIELSVPTVADRFDILKVLLNASNLKISDSDVMNIASAAHGFVPADLQCLLAKAVMLATSHNRSDVQVTDLLWALSQVKPSAMREVLVQVPNVKWTDIGGMDDLKLKLQQTIEWPVRHPECFSRLGVNPPRGILMYGPPGCSKTMIAKALATESNLNFLSIKGSELFSKWVGESEKAVQSLFKKARAVAPSIVFLDELDALGGERSGSSEGNNVQERVLAQLLTEMDGVEPLGNVNIVAATNRPDRIDKALLRPGRLDRMVYVPLPNLATRICILQLQLVKMPVANDIVIDDLALKTEGYSGAEVIAVCHEAAINALQEDFNVSEVHKRHFASALELVKPRTPPSLLKLYDTYLKS